MDSAPSRLFSPRIDTRTTLHPGRLHLACIWQRKFSMDRVERPVLQPAKHMDIMKTKVLIFVPTHGKVDTQNWNPLPRATPYSDTNTNTGFCCSVSDGSSSHNLLGSTSGRSSNYFLLPLKLNSAIKAKVVPSMSQITFSGTIPVTQRIQSPFCHFSMGQVSG